MTLLESPTAIDRNEWEGIMRRIKAPQSSIQHVALTMATFADPDGTRVFPGVKLLVMITRYTKATVSRAVKWLREAGFILLVKRGNRHAEESDEYRLSTPWNILEWLSMPGALSPDWEVIA